MSIFVVFNLTFELNYKKSVKLNDNITDQTGNVNSFYYFSALTPSHAKILLYNFRDSSRGLFFN